MDTPTITKGWAQSNLSQFIRDCECYDVSGAIEDAFEFLQCDAGFYVNDDGIDCDHAWNLAPDSIIVDATCSQFGEKPIGVYPPDNPQHSRYRSWYEHHNPDNGNKCLLRELKSWQDCEVCDYKGSKEVSK